MQAHWREVEGEQWADDFEKMKDKLDDKISYMRYLDSLTDEQAQAELQNLGQRIASISDPKLQRSKFVQLMAKMGQGSVTVEGQCDWDRLAGGIDMLHLGFMSFIKKPNQILKMAQQHVNTTYYMLKDEQDLNVIW